METTPYLVKLPVFEGPLDLLLCLIEREELDITEVSLAQVTDQFLEYVRTLERVDLDVLADFLVVAAQLLVIKSRVLLPSPPPARVEEEEEEVDLVARLIEYRRFKEAAAWLRAREERGWRSYVRLAPPPKPPKSTLEGASLADLLEAARQALCILPPAPPVSELVSPLKVTVEEKMDLIRKVLKRRGKVGFHRLLLSSASRLEVIVTFLALLELIKRGLASVRQERPFGEILIFSRESSPTEALSSGLR